MIGRWLDRFDRVLTIINIALMGTMALLVMGTVILRYVFSICYSWTEELIAMTFVMSSLLGSVSAARRNEHIGIDFIYRCVSPSRVRIVRIGASLVVILTMGVMIKASLPWITVSLPVHTPAMQLPFYWFYSVLPISFALIIAYEVVKIAHDICGDGKEDRP